MVLHAYAKINLGLRILNRRPDGYHNIETIFHRINVWDTITIEPSDQLTLLCSDPSLPADGTNLCLQAAHILQAEFSLRTGARISLQKAIPSGAGLGGGSSDGATTLNGLAALWNIHPSPEVLASMAIRLGSDVPYFLHAGPAYATGRGEILESIDLSIPYWIVVVVPDIHVPTGWAYQNSILQGGVRSPSLREIVTRYIRDPQKLQEHARNDFQELVFRMYPAIAGVARELHLNGAVYAQLSGSGSAVFGFFEKQPDIDGLKCLFPQRFRIYLTPPYFNTQ